MREFNVDFHIHSKYSGGTSPEMMLPEIARQAELKGLDLVGTGDALHPKWIEHMKNNLALEVDGVYSIGNSKTRFMITTEVEDSHRVHHLILLPSVSSAEDLGERLETYSVDIKKDGRPHLRLDGKELVDHVKGVGGLVGPSHAFTPWTALYKEYDSIRECYGDNVGDVGFLELGLSADTSMADRISELSDLTFMSNSDCHSPWPHRLGREFNRLLLRELGFEEVKNAIVRHGGRKFILNVGLNPREGKYHLTACSRCYIRFKLEDAIRLNFKCPECRGRIKKGVLDRIGELSDLSTPKHPRHRPPYIHILPLAEVISLVLGVKSPLSSRVQSEWKRFVDVFGSEINVLVDADVSEIKKIDSRVGGLVDKFRREEMGYVTGGGGQYGRPTLTGEEDRFWGYGQKSLMDF